MNFDYNCTSNGREGMVNISEIYSKIYDFPCNSSHQGFGLSYSFYDCLFTPETMKKAVSRISQHLLDCSELILNSLACNRGYLLKLRFINKINNTAIRLEDVENLVGMTHYVGKFFNELAIHTLNSIIYLENYGIIKETADHLFKSCKNIKVFLDPFGFIGRKAEPGGFLMETVVRSIYDSNRFYTVVSSEDSDHHKCVFNQRLLDSTEASDCMDQYSLASIHPLAISSLVVSYVAGLVMLGKYIYDKFLNYKNEQHATKELAPEADLDELDGSTFLGTVTEEGESYCNI